MTNAKRAKQTDLFKSMQLLRLQNDMKLVNEKLEKNRSTPVRSDDNFVKRFFDSRKNDIKDYKSFNLSKTKDAIQSEIDKFMNNVNGTSVTLYKEMEISRIAADIFSDDEYFLEKTMFSISLIFDGEYNYEYESEGLAYLSRLLWSDSEKLGSIKKNVEGYYKDLAKQPLSTEQKFVLGGVAALTLFTVTVPALAIGGLSAAGITSTLAGLGGTMVEGVGFIALAELLLYGAIIGFTYALMDKHNKNKVKEAFREMSYNDAAQMLAIKCYIMHVAKQTMPKSVFKEKTSELLEMISDLKSDTDYVLLVEGENVAENKKKINVFHNLDNKLGKMLCV
jgi:gas vesicle protein